MWYIKFPAACLFTKAVLRLYLASNELSGNFTKGRANIEEEFTRKRGAMYLMVENATYEDIINHNYKTEYKPLSYLATLNSFEARYNLKTAFVKRQAAGNFIYHKFLYYLREYFVRGLS